VNPDFAPAPPKKGKESAKEGRNVHVPTRIVKRLEAIWKQHEEAAEKRAAGEEIKNEERKRSRSEELYRRRVESCNRVVG